MVEERRKPTQTGDKVRFRVSDVFLPSQDALRFTSIGEDELEGTIVDFSDSGQNSRVFAVIDVVRTKTVVVPVEKLQTLPTNNS